MYGTGSIQQRIQPVPEHAWASELSEQQSLKPSPELHAEVRKQLYLC